MTRRTAAGMPRTVAGLPTTGLMGAEPMLTVGGLTAAGWFVLTLLSSYFGWTPPDDVRIFFDAWGVHIAGIVVALVTAVIGRSRVVSPATAAEIKVQAESAAA